MRRLLAILLLAAFGLPTVAPLLAVGQDAEMNLPMCCRRNGTHHCMMNMAMRDSSATSISALCPSYPRPSAVPAHLKPLALLRPQAVVELPLQLEALTTSVDSRFHLIREIARPSRGPPAQLL